MALLGSVDKVEGLKLIQALVPKNKTDAPPNTYTGNFGRSEFPLHTDLAQWAIPPRYIGLRCIRGFDNVATRLIDSKNVISAIGKDALRMTLVQPRRPFSNGKQLMRLLELRGKLWSIRWDSLFLVPASKFSLTIFQKVKEHLDTCMPREISLINRGDTLIVDNWRLLHGRSAALNFENRRIERVYLKDLR